MRETRTSGSEGGGANPIVSPYPYPGNRRIVALDARFRGHDIKVWLERASARVRNHIRTTPVSTASSWKAAAIRALV